MIGQSFKLYSKVLIMLLQEFEDFHCGIALQIFGSFHDIFFRISNVLIANIMHFVIIWQLASIRENFDEIMKEYVADCEKITPTTINEDEI